MFTLALHLMVNGRVLLAGFNKKYKYPRVQNQIRPSEGAAHLQDSDLLAVAEQAESEGVFVVEAGADLAASERQRGDVALQVVPVLVEEQLVVFQAAPALPPAVVGQHVQVACRSKQKRSGNESYEKG